MVFVLCLRTIRSVDLPIGHNITTIFPIQMTQDTNYRTARLLFKLVIT